MESYIADKVTYVNIVERLTKRYSSIRFDACQRRIRLVTRIKINIESIQDYNVSVSRSLNVKIFAALKNFAIFQKFSIFRFITF